MVRTEKQLNHALQTVKGLDDLKLLINDTLDSGFILVHCDSKTGLREEKPDEYTIVATGNPTRFKVYEGSERKVVRFYRTMAKYFRIRRTVSLPSINGGKSKQLGSAYNLIEV